MITNIAHAAYNTQKFDEMLDFYCGKLGLTKSFDLKRDDGSIWLQYIKIAHDQFIEIFNEPVDDNCTLPKYSHLSLQTDDIEADVARLRGLGVEIVSDICRGADNSFQAWIADPDGNRVELMMLTDQSLQRK